MSDLPGRLRWYVREDVEDVLVPIHLLREAADALEDTEKLLEVAHKVADEDRVKAARNLIQLYDTMSRTVELERHRANTWRDRCLDAEGVPLPLDRLKEIDRGTE